MSSRRKLLLATAVIIAFVAILYILPILQKPSESAKLVPAGSEFDVDENTFPEPPMTTIYVFWNSINYASDEVAPIDMKFFAYLPMSRCEFYDGNNFYICTIEKSSRSILFSNPLDGNIRHSFRSGTMSDTYIEFPTGEKYYLYVPETQNYIMLLLAAGKYEAQFSKSFWFKGTDLDGDLKPDVPYYLPYAPVFGFKKGLAIFEVDTDDDNLADLKFYIDNETHSLVQDRTKAKYAVVFWKAPYWRGFSTDGAKKYNETVIIKRGITLTIRMPASSSLAEEIEQK